ncbi:MAG: hypothetical protein ACRENO_01100 [Thermodesulfobacteriota bacterium]
MNELMFSLLSGIISGVIAGIIVYFAIEYKERQDWKKSKGILANHFNISLNHSLSSIRGLAGIPPPENVRNDHELLEYLYNKFGPKCLALSTALNTNLNLNRYKIFITNIQAAQDEVSYLQLLFISFRKADKWYIEQILEFSNRVNKQFWAFYVFPEIADPKFIEDPQIIMFKHKAIKDVIDFCNFTLELKKELIEK